MDTTTNFPEIAEEEDDEYDELTPIASHCNTPKPCTLSSLSLLHAISLAPPHLSSLLHLHSRLHSPAMTRGMNIQPLLYPPCCTTPLNHSWSILFTLPRQQAHPRPRVIALFRSLALGLLSPCLCKGWVSVGVYPPVVLPACLPVYSLFVGKRGRDQNNFGVCKCFVFLGECVHVCVCVGKGWETVILASVCLFWPSCFPSAYVCRWEKRAMSCLQ